MSFMTHRNHSLLKQGIPLTSMLILIALLSSPLYADEDQSGTQPKATTNVKYDAEATELKSFVAEKEAALSKNRLSRIKKMEKILSKNAQYRGKPALLFQIAELEWDEAKYRYFLKRKDYDAKYESYLDGTLKKRPVEPKPDYTKALDKYNDLLKNFPNYEKIDQVMFYLAQGYKEAEDLKKMASLMNRLVKEHPQSKFRTRAYLALAEMFFDRNTMLAAKQNYEKVIEDKKAPEYPFALYKLGYAFYNLSDYENSIKTFKEVIDIGLGGGKIAFQDQAYSAIALSFTGLDIQAEEDAEIANPKAKSTSNLKGWERARDYFKDVQERAKKPTLMTEMLEKMARIYNKQGGHDSELAIYEFLIKEDGRSYQIPMYADAMIEVYKLDSTLPGLDQTEQQINRFLDYLSPESKTSLWHKTNSAIEDENHKSAVNQALQFRQVQLDWMITTFHKKAQELEKEKGEKFAASYYDRAAKYYDSFLNTFPDDSSLYEKEFFLAEILSYQQQKWDNAIKHYTGVMKRDPTGKYSKESAYKVILCAEEKMAIANLIPAPEHFVEGKKDTKAQAANVEYTKGNVDDDFKPVPEKAIAQTELDFLAACKNYTDTYPTDDEVPAISFRAAELYIRAGHYQEGIGRLEVIMTHHSKHKFASYAAATLFDANYRLRRWDQMERWGRYMLDKKNFAVLNRNQLEDIIAVSINNYADELSQKGTKLKNEGKITEGQELQDQAVNQMLRFIKEFPKHPKAAIALSNAAFLTERAERTKEAVELYESLIQKYKKSPQATEAHFVLGALYESQTKFEEAAEYFEKMASFPDIDDMSKIKDSLYNAGAIRMALQQYSKAIKIFSTYVNKFKDDEATPALYLQIAFAHEKMKKWKDARSIYKKYESLYSKNKTKDMVKIHLLTAENYQKEGSSKARKLASDELTIAMNLYKKLPESEQSDKQVKYSASRVRFLEAEYIYQDFKAYEVIPYPQRKLVKTLQGKAELQQKAEKMYLEVLALKSYQVSAGAFYRIADLYNTFAKSLTGLKPPPELEDNPELLDVYLIFIEEKVLPLEEKAVESARGALKLAHENRVYNEWSKRSAELLSKLSPELFPILNDEVVNTEWEVPATFSSTYISDPAGSPDMMLRKAEAAKEDDKKGESKSKATELKNDAKATDAKADKAADKVQDTAKKESK